jgi:hypothetical protein
MCNVSLDDEWFQDYHQDQENHGTFQVLLLQKYLQ